MLECYDLMSPQVMSYFLIGRYPNLTILALTTTMSGLSMKLLRTAVMTMAKWSFMSGGALGTLLGSHTSIVRTLWPLTGIWNYGAYAALASSQERNDGSVGMIIPTVPGEPWEREAYQAS